MFLSRARRLTQQSTVRLALGLILVFLMVTAVAGALTFFFVQQEVNRMADARLTAQADLIEAAIAQDGDLPDPAVGQQYLVITDNGEIGSLPFETPDRRDGAYFYDRQGPEFRYLIRTLPSGERVVISENAERQDELLDTLLGGLFAALGGILVIGIIASLWFALRSQRRLDLISAGLGKVAQGDLNARITLPGRADDLSQLAGRINATTDRLSQSMEQMRVQSSNIAHDLRTPLARLRAGLETSLNDLALHEKPVAEDTLETALEQIDQLVATFNALLRLSRIESGAGKSAFKTVDLGDLAEHLSDTYRPVVDDCGQSLVLEITEPAQVLGDWDLLVQLLANLIQNALRYGEEGHVIKVQVHGHTVSLVDQGPGIPLDERENVLKPLYQMEKTRQNDGFGLGLSMVAATAKLHDATLSLSDGHDGRGLTVTIRFPKLTNL